MSAAASADLSIGLDAHEFDAELDRVAARTAIAAEGIETVERESEVVHRNVQQLAIENEAALRKTVSSARQVASLVRGLAIASGNAFDEVFAIGIEVTLLTAEVLIDIATAEATTLVGLIGIGARIGQIIALIAKANQLRQGRTEAARRTEGIIQSLSAVEALFYR